LTILFCFIGCWVGMVTLGYVAFNKSQSSIELLAPLVSPVIIIALHLLWKSIWNSAKRIGKKLIDPHNQGIQ
jgi:amino acid permease